MGREVCAGVRRRDRLSLCMSLSLLKTEKKILNVLCPLESLCMRNFKIPLTPLFPPSCVCTSCKQSRSCFHGNSYLCEDLTLSHWNAMQKCICIQLYFRKSESMFKNEYCSDSSIVHLHLFLVSTCITFNWQKIYIYESFIFFLLCYFEIQPTLDATYHKASLVISLLLKSIFPHKLPTFT